MIVADTGAVIALADSDDRHHRVLRALFQEDPSAWVLPWAILPEVDYFLTKHLGAQVELEFVRDLSDGRWVVEWGIPADLERASELLQAHAALEMGLTDAVVMATAERLQAHAIATLDLRDFGAVKLRGAPKLLPRDL
ncbi:MAG: type II toxin-antitoxin system VapC family toxin [Rhodothermia bacterium]